jgi:opacity protein-like surface antigen
MRRILAVSLLLFLVAGCAATPDVPQARAGGAAGATRGGDADASQFTVEPNTVVAQPGATGVVSRVENRDQVQNTAAGDSPQFVLGGGGTAAFNYLMSKTEVEEILGRQIALAEKERTAEGADTAAVDRRVDELRERLVAYEKEKLAAARTISGSFEQLRAAVFLVIQIKSNGSDVDKIDASAIEKAVAGIEKAVAPATKAVE